MTKKWKIILICFFILPCVVFFGGCSCKDNTINPQDKLEFNVSFYTGTDETFNIPNQQVKYGHLVYRPIEPIREDYTFAGWYKDMNFNEIWRFESDTVKDTLILYAKWDKISNEDNTYTVQFFTNSSQSVIPAQIVEKGGLVDKPEDPTKINFTFGGWYRDEELTIRWNFQTNVVDKNLFIYAKWIPIGE